MAFLGQKSVVCFFFLMLCLVIFEILKRFLTQTRNWGSEKCIITSLQKHFLHFYIERIQAFLSFLLIVVMPLPCRTRTQAYKMAFQFSQALLWVLICGQWLRFRYFSIATNSNTTLVHSAEIIGMLAQKMKKLFLNIAKNIAAVFDASTSSLLATCPNIYVKFYNCVLPLMLCI